MKIQFLGTAAFEGIPALFCTCEFCEKCLASGGKDIRTRTSVMIDDELKLDFPPDSFHHMLKYKLNYEEMRELLFTHSHSDHFYVEDLMARLPGYAKTKEHSLQIYGNKKVISQCQEICENKECSNDKFQFHIVQSFQKIHLRSSIAYALPAIHDSTEECFIYYIEKGGKRILYGHDSGWFPEETWQWLKGKKLDVVILECTMGHADYDKTHMNIEAVIRAKSLLKQWKVIDESSKVIVTHFSHNAQLTHRELCNIFSPHQMITAYDGLTLYI